MLPAPPDTNRLWSEFSEADKAALAPELRPRHFERGELLLQAEQYVSSLYFPVSTMISDVIVLADGRSSAVASIGRDGAAGLSAFLAGARTGWNIEVHVEGMGYVLPAATLRRRLDQSDGLRASLIAFNQWTHIEAAQNAACAAAAHPAVSRVARWLLTAQDCTGSDVIVVSQEDVSKHLSLRRTTVTSAAATLREAGACSYLRQRIRIESRDVLRSHACGCYEDLLRHRSRAGASDL